MLRRLLAAFSLVAIAVSAQAFESKTISISHEGRDRVAIMDAPRGAANAPVLIVFHGGLAGPRTVRSRAQVGLAREGWVVLWPSAIDDWNDGRTDRFGQPYDDADDVGFIRALVGALARQGVVDPSRVFVAGPSIGGVMALKMVCDAPDLVAGAAVAIASLPERKDCIAGPPRPVLYIHGSDDRIMPPEGGRIGGSSLFVRDRGRVQSVDDTLVQLARRNGCDGFVEASIPDRVVDDGSTVRLREYRGCAAPLVHYVVDGGGHTWPGSRRSALGGRLVGETNQDISATREVEAFFKRIAGGAG